MHENEPGIADRGQGAPDAVIPLATALDDGRLSTEHVDGLRDPFSGHSHHNPVNHTGIE